MTVTTEYHKPIYNLTFINFENKITPRHGSFVFLSDLTLNLSDPSFYILNTLSKRMEKLSTGTYSLPKYI